MDVIDEATRTMREAALEVTRLRALLNRIQFEMDGRQWSADTLDRIAETLRAGGYPVREIANDDGG
jgi:hypothetical protein